MKETTYLQDAAAVLAAQTSRQQRVHSQDRTFSLRALPYRLQNGTINGATLVFADISDALSMEQDLASARSWRDLAVKAAGIGVWEYFPIRALHLRQGAVQFWPHSSCTSCAASRGGVGVDIIAAMLMSMSAALAIGGRLAAATVALGYSGGTFLEAFAEGRARREMRDLLSRVPHTATRHRNGSLWEVPLGALAPWTFC